MIKKTILYIVLATAGLLTACSGSTAPQVAEEVSAVQVEGGEYYNVNVPKLQSMLEKKDFVFVNVHIPFAGDIPDTDLSIPYDQIEQNLGQLPEDKDAKIVVYCRSGSMSSVAAQELVKLGYTNVWNLENGFNAWQQAGLPLIENQ